MHLLSHRASSVAWLPVPKTFRGRNPIGAEKSIAEIWFFLREPLLVELLRVRSSFGGSGQEKALEKCLVCCGRALLSLKKVFDRRRNRGQSGFSASKRVEELSEDHQLGKGNGVVCWLGSVGGPAERSPYPWIFLQDDLT